MRGIIVGGGKVGYYILKTLIERKYEVVMIERNPVICSRIAKDVNAIVLCGDGTDTSVLTDADIANVEIVAAVTGKDEENLVICQIAKLKFNVAKTIARINNPKNITLFRQLGVDRTVSSTEVIANLIEWELEDHGLKIVQTIDTGGLLLAEATIGVRNFWIDHEPGTIRMPASSRLITLIREGVGITKFEGEKLQVGDRMLLLTTMQEKTSLEQAIFEVARYGY